MMLALQAGGPDASGKPKACNRQALQAFGVKKEKEGFYFRSKHSSRGRIQTDPCPFALPLPWRHLNGATAAG
jgi:hypothetical protein